MDTDLLKKRTDLVNWLMSLEDMEIINKISELKKAEHQDWWQNLTKAEQDSIDLGISDADQGKIKPHSEAKKVYGKWL